MNADHERCSSFLSAAKTLYWRWKANVYCFRWMIVRMNNGGANEIGFVQGKGFVKVTDDSGGKG